MRPKELQPYMIPVVKEALSKGLPLKLAAGLIGVSRAVFQQWKEKGEAEDCTDELYIQFAQTIELCRSNVAVVAVETLQGLGAMDGKIMLALLRAQDPEIWCEKKDPKVEVNVNVPSATAKDYSKLTTEELEQYAAFEEKLQKRDE